jgi:hypothetical protein
LPLTVGLARIIGRTMKTFSIIMAAALACVACGKGSKGGVDKGAFDKLLDGTHHGDAWATATAAADKVLGPAKIKTDGQWTWAVVDGDACWELDLMKDGDKVAGVGGGLVDKMIEKPFARCAAKARGTAPE